MTPVQTLDMLTGHMKIVDSFAISAVSSNVSL